MNKVKISSIAHHLPGTGITNQEIIEENGLRLKSEWVELNIGIKSRHWCQDGELASDLAAVVGEKLIREIAPSEIGALILATVSPDMITPATAAITQAKLTPGMSYPAFDMVSACSGFLFALDAGRRFVASGMNHILCISSEIRSYYLDKQDRRTVMLFGDGAAGVRLSPCQADEVGIIYSQTFTDGRFWEVVSAAHRGKIIMKDAGLIFTKAVEKMQELLIHGLRESGLELEDIKYFIFHQASRPILEKMTQSLGISSDRYYMNFERVGNTSSASVPIALSEAYLEGKFKKGDFICLLATGGGFSAGITILRWEMES